MHKVRWRRVAVSLACSLGAALLTPSCPELACATSTGEVPWGYRPKVIERTELELQVQYAKEFRLTPKARREMKVLTALKLNALGLPFHGKDHRDASGHWESVPDIGDARAALQGFRPDGETIRLFAVIAAAADNIRQREKEAGDVRWMPSSTHGEVREREERNKRLHVRYRTIVESQLAIAATAYHRLKKHIGDVRLAKITTALQNRVIRAQIKTYQSQEVGRRRAIEECRRGLRSCSFSGGLPDNCAGYLHMTVKELQARCPVIKRLHDVE